MNAIVGALCLGALWIVALLVAGAAIQDLRDRWATRARLGTLRHGQLGVGVFECEVLEGNGPGNALAMHEVAQVGRALDEKVPAIAFRDTAYASRVYGGLVRMKGSTEQPGDAVEIPGEAVRASVWTSDRARTSAARRAAEGFDEAYAAACSVRGYRRTVTTTAVRGDRVFVAGNLARRGEGLALQAAPNMELIVATEDPIALMARQCVAAVFFVAAELLACTACTVLAMWPPAFGRTSTAGGALCLTFFLGVTPLGVWLRERSLPPSRAPLHGSARKSECSLP